jgi:hypothetical protein
MCALRPLHLSRQGLACAHMSRYNREVICFSSECLLQALDLQAFLARSCRAWGASDLTSLHRSKAKSLIYKGRKRCVRTLARRGRGRTRSVRVRRAPLRSPHKRFCLKASSVRRGCPCRRGARSWPSAGDRARGPAGPCGRDRCRSAPASRRRSAPDGRASLRS